MYKAFFVSFVLVGGCAQFPERQFASDAGEGEGEGPIGEGEGEGPLADAGPPPGGDVGEDAGVDVGNGEGEGEGQVGEGEGEGEGPFTDAGPPSGGDAGENAGHDAGADAGQDAEEDGGPLGEGEGEGPAGEGEGEGPVGEGEGEGPVGEGEGEGPPPECEQDGQGCSVEGQCLRGECRDGQCFIISVDNGTPCNDGSRCTQADRCQNEVCRGTPVSCAHLDEPCVDGQCNAGTGACQAIPKQDLTRCDDELFCTVADECHGGICGGALRNCSAEDELPCVVGVCDEEVNACVPDVIMTNGAVCDDSNRCTGDGACQDGQCQPGVALDCSRLTNQCNTGVCDPNAPAGDPCVADAVDNGTQCTDGNDECTLGDTCQNGGCVAGPLPDVDQDGHVPIACGGDDCDDGAATVYSRASELCDGLDNDCDGEVDRLYSAPPWDGWTDGGFARFWSNAAIPGCRRAGQNFSHYVSSPIPYQPCRVEVCLDVREGRVRVDVANQESWEVNPGDPCYLLPVGVANPIRFDMVALDDVEHTVCFFELRGVFGE